VWHKQLRLRTSIWNSDETIWNWHYVINKIICIIYISWSETKEVWSVYVIKEGKKIHFDEKTLELAKLKSLLKAKELGWNIEKVI